MLCFRTPCSTQCTDWSQTLVKSERGQFCPIVSFLWVKVRLKTSLLVSFEILGLFSTQWLPMASILDIKRKISRKQFKFNYLKNQISFINFSLHFQNLHQISNILKRKINLILNYIRYYWLRKIFLPKCLKGYVLCFRTPFATQCVEWSQTLVKFKR